jgi:hypothetical protein
MSRSVQATITVYMDRRDVTPWVRDVRVWHDSGRLYREFEVTLKGYSQIPSTSRWDIYGSLDPAVPRSELVIRNGVIPAEYQPRVDLMADAPDLLVQVHGFDFAWEMVRRAPRETLVLLPGAHVVTDEGRVIENRATTALAEHDGAVGRYRVINNLRTMRRAVEALAQLAGVGSSMHLPDYPLRPYVVPVSMSYYDAIVELVEPWAPYVTYLPSHNKLVIHDRLEGVYQLGRTMRLTQATRIDSVPIRRRRTRRVICQYRGA